MAKKTIESAQIVLMQRIKDALPSHLSLVDELADLLKVSNDSAYRRIRGETALSIEEISSICRHFKISFDAFINSNDDSFVSFSHHRLNSHVNTFREYLQSIKNDLDKLLMFDENNREIIFAAEDIPVFQHFAHPFLTAFKIFYWNRSILNAKGFEDKKFDITHVDKDLLQTASDIYERYSRISSIEVWSDDTVNSTLKQIEFYWDAGAFNSKEDALKVCEEANLMFIRISKQAERNMQLDSNGKPAASANNYSLYHSDVMIGNNCVLVKMGGIKGTYISYHTFNVMLTTNVNFCDETDIWLKNLISKSNLISGVAEKQRYRYFKRIDDSLKKLVAKIEND
ncbi:MAG: helix-turn-helix domain-containing protein [Bacteroidota bacterium]|nr:helix-turn-helix domain-containing protein [Bacteroidota bacterium]